MHILGVLDAFNKISSLIKLWQARKSDVHHSSKAIAIHKPYSNSLTLLNLVFHLHNLDPFHTLENITRFQNLVSLASDHPSNLLIKKCLHFQPFRLDQNRDKPNQSSKHHN
jgi:hypothetical protein